MKINRLTGAAIAAVALVGSLTACGSTSSTSSSAGSTTSAGVSKSAPGASTPAGAAAPSSSGGTVTVYSADGLADWYKPQFAAFTKATGITVEYVEAGSSEVVSRIEKEKSNPQADVLITLPPFIQQADKDGILAPLGVDTTAVAAADKSTDGNWTALVNNYSCFIVSSKQTPAPKTWDDLLTATYKGKLQYSTPGQAGDGTAVLVLLQHEMGKQGALDYLKKLQTNNVGPSSSTGKLQPKVSSGTLLTANGDVQMNLSSIQTDKSAFSILFPADGSKAPETLALPYDMGLTSNAPHSENAKKLMTFLLSPTAQTQISSAALGIPVRTDVHPTDANYAKVQAAMKGVQVYHPDWDAVSASLDADVAAYNDAIGS